MSTGFLFTTLPCFHINETRIDRLVQLVDHLYLSGEIIGDGIEDDVRETILSYIKGLEDVVTGGEVAVYQQTDNNYKVWLTGGMSSGDAPTDAFEVLAALGSFDSLWETMEAFAIDDLQEEAYLNN